MAKSQSKFMIGSCEWCAFPELDIPAVKARVDSGAKTSCLHAFDIQPYEKNGVTWVRFEVHPLQKNQRISFAREAEVVDRRKVKSSSGEVENRYVIASMLKIGEFAWPVELTLTNRDSMGYRMLLGREAMRGKVIIDPDETYLLGKISQAKLEKLYHTSLGKKSR